MPRLFLKLSIAKYFEYIFAGPISGSSVLTGLAAGLRPQYEFWPSTSYGASRRKIENIYGVTLAADLAQTALMKKRGQKYVGPDGYFNNSLCPSEFLLTSENSYGDPTFSHLTIAEINGGIDGLILGLNAEDWEKRSEMSLSQVRIIFSSFLFKKKIKNYMSARKIKSIPG